MTEVNEILKKQPILLFDGECGFCNRTVQFFLNQESRSKANTPGKRMYFAPLQSDIGQALLRYFEIDRNTDSIILIRHHSAYIKSCAALRLSQYMRGLWPLMMIFVLVPPFIRNFVYDMIAKRRMKLFGRVESCELLQKEERERFLAM